MKDKNTKYYIYLIPIFSIVYLHYLYIKFDDFDGMKDLSLSFLLFGLGTGLIISSLNVENPMKLSFRVAFVIPILCFIVELLFVLAFMQPLYGGGPVSTPIYINIGLMLLGGGVLGMISMAGCKLGMFFRHFVGSIAKSILSERVSKEKEATAAYIGAIATISTGIIASISSIILAVIK